MICERSCCAQHPQRICTLVKGHDGDHDDQHGHRWRAIEYLQRKDRT